MRRFFRAAAAPLLLPSATAAEDLWRMELFRADIAVRGEDGGSW